MQNKKAVRTIRTLVIEDNATNLELMTYILSAFGHTTIAAVDGEEGMKAAVDATPSVIVCDVQLPKVDGYEVARRLKADPELRHIPLIAVTALAMVGDRERVLAAGFDGYIPKPITPDAFVRQVESFLPEDERLGQLQEEPSEAVSECLAASVVKRGTILVINHSPQNVELSRRILEPSGFTVIAEEDYAAALSIAGLTRPDLVLYDVHGHGDRGGWFVESFSSDARLRPTPIILLSSSTWRESDRKTAGSAPVRFLLRPIDPSILLGEINSCLAEATPAESVE